MEWGAVEWGAVEWGAVECGMGWGWVAQRVAHHDEKINISMAKNRTHAKSFNFLTVYQVN